jgi:aspartate 1-decarboxylase
MLREFLRAKIQKLTLTKLALDYQGSIGIDEALLEASGILPGEKVQVLNFNNGSRLETYVIKEKKNSGIVALYGPAARWGEVGDKLCVLSYTFITDEEAKSMEPKLLWVDDENKLLR